MRTTECFRRTPRSAVGIALAAGALLTACNTGTNTREDAAKGAVAGAVVGAIAGHQSDEAKAGAAIGAATGAAIGGAIGASKDRDARERGSIGEPSNVGAMDYEDLMTPAEKERVLARSGRQYIEDWSDYLTAEEKEQLRERSRSGFGS